MSAVLVEIHATAERYFRARLWASWVPAYLAARGLGAALDDAAGWGIGYAPGRWAGLVRHLRGRGYADADVIASGLGKPSRRGGLIDRFRDRAMMPVRTAEGTTIAFIGRARPRHPAGVPKYLNSPHTPLYTKGATLYGLDVARPRLAAGAAPVIVEGSLDAIAVTLADPTGTYAALAPSGTALTQRQVDGLDGRPVTLAFDADDPGRRAALRASALLPADATRALLPAGRDPAGLLQDLGPRALHAALAARRPLAELRLDAHLAETAGQPSWSRRDHAAALIAVLVPPDTAATIARANRPAGDPAAYPYLAPLDAARLLPATIADLLVRAAEDIRVTATEMTIAVVTAVTDDAREGSPRSSRRPVRTPRDAARPG